MCRAGPRAQPSGPGMAPGVPRAGPGTFSPGRAVLACYRAGPVSTAVWPAIVNTRQFKEKKK